jgi:hypothetical protein
VTYFPESCIEWDTSVASEDTFKTMDGSRNEAWRRSRDLFKGKKVKKDTPYSSSKRNQSIDGAFM